MCSGDHRTRTRTGTPGTAQIPSSELLASTEGYRALRRAAPDGRLQPIRVIRSLALFRLTPADLRSVRVR